MYKYGPRRKLKSKYYTKLNTPDKTNFLKMYNLELEGLNPNTLKNIQNKIGNKATEQLLEQLSKTQIVNDGEDKDRTRLSAKNSRTYNNFALTANQLSDDFKTISKVQSANAGDVLSRDMLYDENRQTGRLKLKAENIDFILEKLDELSSLLKINDFRLQNKRIEIENADKMLSGSEKITVEDTELILHAIKQLPKYNGDDLTITIYMKLLNLLLNTGMNIIEFLENNGHLDVQKKILYETLGARKASE